MIYWSKEQWFTEESRFELLQNSTIVIQLFNISLQRDMANAVQKELQFLEQMFTKLHILHSCHTSLGCART